MTNFAEADWFVRDSVTFALNSHIADIADACFKKKINFDWVYSCEDAIETLGLEEWLDFSECIEKYIALDTLTGEETDFVLEHVALYCVLKQLVREGKIIEQDGAFSPSNP